MSSKAAAAKTVALTSEESTELLQLVESALKETRVEVHRTHTPGFRDKVQHSEEVLRAIATKLRSLGT
jgi:hypothetical protein